ncbi:optineurin-like isoform X2 [Dreissena polymorpha]|uniref:optineurin-like isoform X2 n=1 Tax=Dreissena polymorpha TaxID=45954 RepID=UPI0022655CEC|nr:optineurin-like isoform X2 [Dreissena polymorpha]
MCHGFHIVPYIYTSDTHHNSTSGEKGLHKHRKTRTQEDLTFNKVEIIDNFKVNTINIRSLQMKPMEKEVIMAAQSVASISGSSLALEVERDNYREKVEHFKLLIMKLQEELHFFKAKNEGAETVSKLLQESKQECAGLKKKAGQLESVIKNLQSRLEQHGLSTDIVLNESETYVPGHSKRLLENLTRENTRLRNLIRSKSCDPEELARLQQENADLQSSVAELQNDLKSSADEKCRTINELRQELSVLNNELSSRQHLVTRLVEQRQDLQQQLVSVAEQCRTLASRLDEQAKEAEKVVQSATQKTSQDSSNIAVLAENKELKKQIKEVMEMNRRWQEFHTQREEYVNKLRSDLDRKLASVPEVKASQGQASVEAEFNRMLDKNKCLTGEIEEIKRQRTRLTRDYELSKRDMENAAGQITALKKEIAELSKSGHRKQRESESETINALKAQIQICTEDFESERRDRERAQNKLGRLENEIEHLRKENASLKRTLETFNSSPRWSPATEYTDPAYHQQFIQSAYSSEGLAARGAQTKRVTQAVSSNQHLDRYNVVDSPNQHLDRYNVVDSPNQHIDHNNVVDSPASNTRGIVLEYIDRNETDCDVKPSNYDVLDSPTKPFVQNDVTNLQDEDHFMSLNALSISSHSKDDNNSGNVSSPESSKRNSTDQTRVVVMSSPIVNTMTAEDNFSVLRCPTCNEAFTSDQHVELLEHMEKCI